MFNITSCCERCGKMSKLKVTIKILGETYAVKTDTDEESVQKVAHVLDERMRLIAHHSPNLSPAKIAVLAALNITEEYLRLEEDYKQLLSMIEAEKKAR